MMTREGSKFPPDAASSAGSSLAVTYPSDVRNRQIEAGLDVQRKQTVPSILLGKLGQDIAPAALSTHSLPHPGIVEEEMHLGFQLQQLLGKRIGHGLG